MIGMLKGRVESVDTSNAVVDVHGVGFELRMPSNDLTAMHMGQDVKIYTSMSVSQDAITLFGFLDARSKRMFLQLQKVSGVGPKVALSLLSTLAPDDLAQAIHDGDDKALSRAPVWAGKVPRKSSWSSRARLTSTKSKQGSQLPRNASQPTRGSNRWLRVSCRWAGSRRMHSRLWIRSFPPVASRCHWRKAMCRLCSDWH